ncbi:dnaJ homolog subfamily B member 14-like [Anopheles ziemanni]|uniref:dnaJ homolog subfamily B member 14-like n=1 Tax=Anopheles coustani TaxID=139045 RepID=UPI00265B52F6|nr:dnaJ homolog subfamily B member 14-like [Anopheles coustani]XP_058172192.1 dnaJ homolog subfamily B member 14-like [Anopheles ziemanni]
MESNKEEARRCIQVGTFYLKLGNLEKAEKYLKKSQSLYPLREAEELLSRVKAAKSRTGSNGTTTNESMKPGQPKLNVDFTQEQADVVKRVQKCKDFYELLGISKDATDSEIKKCYKKLALQLHPDKNKAPGAMEAFKSLGNAVETLTDPAKRKAYDLYRITDHSSEGRSRTSGSSARGYGYGQNGFTFRADNGPDINPNDIFNMFFGGGFPQQQHQQHHFYRARGSRGTQYGDANSATGSLFYMVILIVVGVSVLTTFFATDPLYSLQRTNKYSVERHTLNLKIPYYVKNNFLNEYQGSLGRLEYSVEEEYVTYMKRTCSNERTYRDAMIGRAKSFGSRAQFQQAQQLKMPACDTLYRLGIGVVHY